MKTTASRVSFLLELRTPYRDELLTTLDGDDILDVSVLYCTESKPWRDWQLGDAPYTVKTLRGITTGSRSGGFQARLNPSVWSALKATRPQVVILGGYAVPTNQLAMLWCRRHRVPYLLLWESHDLDERTRARRAMAWGPSRAALQGAAGVLPTSSRARERLVRSGFPQDRLYILPNAPDVRRIAEQVTRSGQPPDRPPTFLYSGRLVACKDVPTLLHAFGRVQRELPEARLVVVGSGPLESDLKALSAQLELRHVTFRGFVQPDRLLDEYAGADVFVLPSRHEPFGVVVMEAMAAGMPVVVSDRVGCAGDLIDDSCGVVFPAGDVDRLTSALIMLGTEADRRQEMGRSAAVAVMKWDIDYCKRTVYDAVEEAVRSPARH